MAKKSKIAKNEQRRVVVARHAERRVELKATVASPKSSAAEKAAAVSALQALPRDASPTRLRNRDVADGRPRGVPAEVRRVPGPPAADGAQRGAARRPEVELVRSMAMQLRERPGKKKRNLLAAEGVSEVDWKNVALRRKFISDRGKIRARRVTGLTAATETGSDRHQERPRNRPCCRTRAPAADRNARMWRWGRRVPQRQIRALAGRCGKLVL
jgi:small subunit ribosomal protein S14